jgi:lysozyme family protein
MPETPSPDPIVITAWSPRFLRAVETLLEIEGGYVNHPNDPGGATNHGISLRFLKSEGRIDLDHNGIADFDLDFDGDIDGADIRKLTRNDAKILYERCFWQPLRCDTLPRPLGEMMFDQAVNGGTAAAVRILQRAINLCGLAGVSVIADGKMGPRTEAAALFVIRYPAKGMPALVTAYREMAKARYRTLARENPQFKVFLKGWLRRADELGRS